MPLVMLAAGPARAEEVSARIRVSATIPPRPCQYPARCEPVTTATRSSATIVDGAVSYVGSPPEVIETDGLLTVNF